ncbi:mannitol dehydrogenase family protein [Alteraurantiacibacter palmitatis]|uniref:Mannitol dehydrogenase family protein n=1 Tax=Alteraurantiacibacter palmitatis TaxID=2054628 RepID=A0ABV7E941_9SPHN
MRLAPDTLRHLPVHVPSPPYDFAGQEVGVVHFGLGAFARAHLAAYCDAAMAAGESGWAITGVSLRSRKVSEALNPQGGLYTLTEHGEGGPATYVVGALREVLVAGRESEAIVDRIASASCHMVSFTVTEKGYCRNADGSVDAHAAGASFYPLLAAAMKRRMEQGLPGLTVLCCDNLPENGRLLGRLVKAWLEQEAPDVAGWFAAHCTTPSTMVDRIVPASTPADLAALERRLGMQDRGAVFTEPFSQFVIEDRFAGPRPAFERYGVQMVADVAPYETAKLRMLNGAHSLLAYRGLRAGHEFVHQAMGDPAIRTDVERLMRQEAAPTLIPAPGQDLAAYAAQLMQRFDNPALEHRLAQIAMDGSQKLPQRWLATLAEAQGPCPAILSGIAAFLWHVADGRWLDDPLADWLWQEVASRDIPAQIVSVFGPGGLLRSRWIPSAQDIAAIAAAYEEQMS